MVGLKASWDITAGIIPNQATFHHRYIYTSVMYDEDQERELGEEKDFDILMGNAFKMAREIAKPSQYNWINLNFIWY